MLPGLALAAAGMLRALASVAGDFDHDGVADRAEVIAGNSGVSRLVIKRGGSGLAAVVVATFPSGRYSDFYLEKTRPGILRTWCGKGGDDGKSVCARTTVRVAGDTLSYGQRESTMSVVFWNRVRFEDVLISD